MIARIRTRLASEAGFTLTELLVTLVLMGIVMGAVSQSFSTGIVGEARAIAEATNEENARLALDRLRMDIHCSSAQNLSPGVTAQGGFFIVLTELKDDNNDPICKKISLATNSSWIEWCTIKISTTRWQLYRDNAKECSGDASTFMVDYIIKPDIWTVPLPASCWQLSVGVNLITNEDPGNVHYQYKLSDTIGMRNDTRTVPTGGSC